MAEDQRSMYSTATTAIIRPVASLVPMPDPSQPTIPGPFAVVQMAAPDSERVRRRVYSSFDEIVCARTLAAVPDCLTRVDEATRAGDIAVGFVSYDAAPAFDTALSAHTPSHDPPLLWFGICPAPGPEADAEPPQVNRPNAATPDGPGTWAFGPWQKGLSQEDYRRTFDRIMRHIRDGDTYQINFTFPLTATFKGSVNCLYADMIRAQDARYCAWIHTPEWDVLSLSPEMFFARSGSLIRAMPMKGTRARGRSAAEDTALAAELEANPKDRAENVMIVDMLRNDLGRIAETGSVNVPGLFNVQRFPTVWQMTSDIEATLRPDTGLAELFRALFPCASVTGAPKVETMKIIAEEEDTARGVYCGAVGVVGPGNDAVFNVAIRTLTLMADGSARYPVGSGVVADSDAAAEYTECLQKARVLERAGNADDFMLLETVRWEPDNGFALLDEHLERMAASAAYFNFAFDATDIRRRLDAAAAGWSTTTRVRALLDADGTLTIAGSALDTTAAAAPMTVAIAAKSIDRDDPFMYHKTTRRDVYESARSACPGAADVLLKNAAGELTESTIANLAVYIDGRWVTPPVSCGLLPGTRRADRLARGELEEQVITMADLERAERIQLFNSLRGEWDVVLMDS